MIPVRLQIKDFLSYGDPEPIEFTSFDVACLTGDNGVGKSAFLDAIAWALFGAARGCENGQNQERVIRDGAEEAVVDFTFALGDATYRIVRKRSRKRGDVSFRIGDGDAWTNIAGDSTRETDARIRTTLRMDYETFTASAFFVQGRAEDFLSRMKPDQRKEVFASLLDLGVYERLEEAARVKARDAEARRGEQARLVEQLTAEAGDVDVIRTELATTMERARTAQAKAEAAQAQVIELRTKLGELESVKASADNDMKLIASLQANRERTEEIVRTKRTEVGTIDELIAHTDEVKQALDELERLRREDDALRERERAAAKLREREAEIRERIKAEHDATVHRVEEATAALATLEKERKVLERATRDLEKLTASLEAVQHAPTVFEETRRQLEERRADEARLLEVVRGFDVRAAELEEHATILGRGEGECPVCGTTLDAKHRKDAMTRLRADVRALSKERERTSSELEVVRKEAMRCDEEIRRLRSALAEREQLTSSLEALRARLERLPIVVAEMERIDAQRGADAQLVTQGLTSPELEAELTRVAKERAELYSEAEHKELLGRMERLRPAEQMWMRITNASEQRPVLAKEIEEAEKHAGELAGQIAEREKVLEEARVRLADLPAALEAAERAEECRKVVSAEASAVAAEGARLEERLVTAERTERDLAAAREAELASATEHRRYRRLVEAFGRGGIPDLVIDNVRPELEDEANDILGRLTDYEMDVRFHLKRATKTGKEKDTFDVLVHHGGGNPRDFAMFSGGEAFRIAFAVRLAMSKLLVRRAGAQLETLVIDEGFGTQDPEGRERLVEAINLARREFGKVLVITHLDELKDAFGTQIRVTKDDRRGSVLEVLRS